MKPNEIALTITVEVADYEFKHLRLTTRHDESRLKAIRRQALELVQSLENVISYEIGEVWQVSKPSSENLPYDGSAALSAFLQRHPHWEHDVFWAE